MTDAAPATGPQIGAPPSLEQVPVAMLQVDSTYQRATDGPASRKIIACMVAKWDWRLCQPLIVSRRPDGGLFILDGQHRHAGASQRGDIPFLPCVLLSSLAVEDEASTFVALNTRRQKLSQSDIFHGMLATGDPKAAQVHALLEETGWRLRKSSNTQIFAAGDMNCAPMLVRRIDQDGIEAVRFALLTLRAAWPDKPITSTATFLKALMEVHTRLGEDDPAGSVDRMAATLADTAIDDWTLQATRIRAQNRTLSLAGALGVAMFRAARGDSTPAAPPPPVKPAPAFTPPARTAFNLKGGMAWCSQCEQRRTRDNATNCKDQFCKLKGSL